MIFKHNRAIEHNIQLLIEFQISISPLCLCVQGWICDEVNISLGVFKQQISNDVQQFKVVFLSFIFTYNGVIEHNIQ